MIDELLNLKTCYVNWVNSVPIWVSMFVACFVFVILFFAFWGIYPYIRIGRKL